MLVARKGRMHSRKMRLGADRRCLDQTINGWIIKLCIPYVEGLDRLDYMFGGRLLDRLLLLLLSCHVRFILRMWF